MNRIFRNTATVLVLTIFTGLAVFTAVQLGDRLFGTSDASAQTATTQPSGSSPATSDQGQSPDGYGQSSDPYGYDQGSGSGSQSSSGATQTCPATGCTASSCHASQ
jgi:hypothetical protein